MNYSARSKNIHDRRYDQANHTVELLELAAEIGWEVYGVPGRHFGGQPKYHLFREGTRMHAKDGDLFPSMARVYMLDEKHRQGMKPKVISEDSSWTGTSI